MSIKKDTIILKNLLCFAETTKNGQINSTALKQGMKQSNLSNTIKELEEMFNTKLFNRLHNGITLTETGREVFEIACGIENIIHRVNNFSLSTNKIAGDIRLWTSDGIGTSYISACLPDFYLKYPDVHLDIKCSLESPKIMHEIDMAIVYEEPKPLDTDTVVISKNSLKFKLYAAKNYLSKFGYPENLEDLIENHRICTRRNFELWPLWNNVLEKSKHITATTNSSSMLLSIVKDGVGISLIPTCIGDKEPELMQLNKIKFEIEHPFWIISHKDTKDVPKVRALIDYIKDATGKL